MQVISFMKKITTSKRVLLRCRPEDEILLDRNKDSEPKLHITLHQFLSPVFVNEHVRRVRIKIFAVPLALFSRDACAQFSAPSFAICRHFAIVG